MELDGVSAPIECLVQALLRGIHRGDREFVLGPTEAYGVSVKWENKSPSKGVVRDRLTVERYATYPNRMSM